MASSRGRERAQQRGQRVFVFGSSTPRDLSHMNKIPSHLRNYDSRVPREANHGPKLREYMQKARSLTREGKPGERQWAFGSSTPRDLAHLTTLNASQRRYDSVIPKKSITTPSFVNAYKEKRSSTVAPVTRQVHQENHKAEVERILKDDEVSSEPDFVQDRRDFMNELKMMKEKKNSKEEEKMARQMTHEKYDEPVEMAAEMTQSQMVPQKLHHDEDEAATASEHAGQPVLQDQMVVSDLMGHHEEHAPVQMPAQKVGELMQETSTSSSSAPIVSNE